MDLGWSVWIKGSQTLGLINQKGLNKGLWNRHLIKGSQTRREGNQQS